MRHINEAEMDKIMKNYDELDKFLYENITSTDSCLITRNGPYIMLSEEYLTSVCANCFTTTNQLERLHYRLAKLGWRHGLGTMKGDNGYSYGWEMGIEEFTAKYYKGTKVPYITKRQEELDRATREKYLAAMLKKEDK